MTSQARRNEWFNAIKAQQMDVVERLLSEGINVNLGTDLGDPTALHYAVKTQNEGLVELLLQNSAYVNTTDMFGASPLHYAAETMDPNIIYLLLEKNAEPSLATSAGKRPADLCKDDDLKKIFTEMSYSKHRNTKSARKTST